jgi:DNA polymerase delta subunit 1
MHKREVGSFYKGVDHQHIVHYSNLQVYQDPRMDKIITRPLILSYDIETFSSNLVSFPDANNSQDVVNMISLSWKRYGSDEPAKKKLFILGDCDDIPNCDIIRIHPEENNNVVNRQSLSLTYELQMLNMFLDEVNRINPDIIIGHNIFGFDYPYIIKRLLKHRVQHIWGTVSRTIQYTETYSKTWSSSAHKEVQIVHPDMEGRINIDFLTMIKRDYNFASYSLNYLANKFLKDSKDDVKAVEMFDIYNRYLNDTTDLQDMTKFAKYAVQDADLVLRLFDKVHGWITLIETARAVGVTVAQLYTRGQQLRSLNLAYPLCKNEAIVIEDIPSDDRKYQGGFVGDPITGLHKDVICLDFSSLYPSIMIGYNICSSTYIAPGDPRLNDPEFSKNVTCIEVEDTEADKEEELDDDLLP